MYILKNINMVLIKLRTYTMLLKQNVMIFILKFVVITKLHMHIIHTSINDSKILFLGHAVDRNSLLTLNNYMRTQTFYDAVNLSFIAELIGQQDVIKMVPPSNCITPFFIQTMNALLMCVNYHM